MAIHIETTWEQHKADEQDQLRALRLDPEYHDTKVILGALRIAYEMGQATARAEALREAAQLIRGAAESTQDEAPKISPHVPEIVWKVVRAVLATTADSVDALVLQAGTGTESAGEVRDGG